MIPAHPGFAAVMADLFGPAPPGRIGLAVSGGGDSTALMVLAAGWAQAAGVGLQAVTVDHGLRPGAAEEATAVARLAGRLGLGHATLCWEGGDRQGNLQDAARNARRTLIAGWARERGIATVLLGHTADDQAETVLMRLARGSGVDGLSGMAAWRRAGGIVWARPLLGSRRAMLHDFLRAQGVAWAEDPSNADPRFARVRARRALAGLGPVGIDTQGLLSTADRMRVARAALEDATADALTALATVDPAGDVVLDGPGFDALPAELRLRIAARALGFVSGAAYRPRRAALEALVARGGTLDGCLWTRDASAIRVGREPAAVAGAGILPGAVWDGRWQITGPVTPAGTQVAALGVAGLGACPDWRATGLARTSLIAGPALWQDGRLVAAPLAAPGGPWQAALAPGRARLVEDRDYRVEPVADIAI